MKIVIAIGGNMISDASNPGEPFDEQLKRVEHTAKIITGIINQGHQVVITHGNGPQVGSLLLQQEAVAEGAVKLPLKVLGSMTQGQIGLMLQHALLNEFSRSEVVSNVYVVPTSVIVDRNDPGFEHPTKPIGPFISSDDFRSIIPNGKQYIETQKGFRRVVASPDPKEILEGKLIESLIEESNLVIAVGGGGSPTIREENGKLTLVDAVIDKDLASAVLADQLGADMLLILTNVEGVYRNFGTEDQLLLDTITLSDANQMLQSSELGTGSMEPKVKAAVRFTSGGPNRKAGITVPEFALDTILGNAGTIITS